MQVSVSIACRYINISNVYYGLYFKTMSPADMDDVRISKTVPLNVHTYKRQRRIAPQLKLTSFGK